MLTNRLGHLGILMEDSPWMDVQPVTSLVIRASLPEMTRVLLGARVAFYIQGVQHLDAPWSKSVQLDAVFQCMAPCLHLLVPICPHHFSAGCPLGMAWPIQAGQLHARQRSATI